MLSGNPASRAIRHIEELPIAAIPEQLPRLLERFAYAVLVHKRIYMARRHKQVRPPVVIEIEERRPPLHILRMHGQPGSTGRIRERSIAIVVIKRIAVA